MPLTPAIYDAKISRMFVFLKPTDTKPIGELLICTGIASNFGLGVFGPNTQASDVVRFAIPNLSVAERHVLETTVLVTLAEFGSQGLPGQWTYLLWSLDDAQASQIGHQVVVDAKITVKGTDNIISKLAYHVTVLLRLPG